MLLPRFADLEPLPPDADTVLPTEEEPLALTAEPEETRNDRFIAFARKELGAKTDGSTDAEQFAAALEVQYTHFPRTLSQRFLRHKTLPDKTNVAHYEHVARAAMGHAILAYDPAISEHGKHFVSYLQKAMEAAIEAELEVKRRAARTM